MGRPSSETAPASAMVLVGRSVVRRSDPASTVGAWFGGLTLKTTSSLALEAPSVALKLRRYSPSAAKGRA